MWLQTSSQQIGGWNCVTHVSGVLLGQPIKGVLIKTQQSESTVVVLLVLFFILAAGGYCLWKQD